MDLRFDPNRHDRNVQQTVSSEIRERIKRELSSCYIRWKKRLTSKPKTPQEVIQQLYELRDLFADKVKDVAEFKDWWEISQDMFDDMISRAIRTGINERNYVVEFLTVDEAKQRAPRSAAPSSVLEFEEIPWVGRFKGSTGFIGFYRDQKMIGAWINNEPFQRVCYAANNIGVGGYPEAEQIIDGIEKLRSGKIHLRYKPPPLPPGSNQ